MDLNELMDGFNRQIVVMAFTMHLPQAYVEEVVGWSEITNVPREFAQAYKWHKDRGLHIETLFRDFAFPNVSLQRYAEAYCFVLSLIKSWKVLKLNIYDALQPMMEPYEELKRSRQKHIDAMCITFNCTEAELQENLSRAGEEGEKTIQLLREQEIMMATYELEVSTIRQTLERTLDSENELVKLAIGALFELEQTMPEKGISKEALIDFRNKVENYFGQSPNRARVILLGQEPRK